MKVYVVTSGDYSAYSINSVFSTKELAEQYKVGIEDANEIEEYELDGFKDQMRDGFCWWRIQMKKDGEVIYAEPQGWEKPSFVDGNTKIWFYERYYFQGGNSIKYIVLEVYCKSDTKERAVKITNEIRTQLIAQNQWRDE